MKIPVTPPKIGALERTSFAPAIARAGPINTVDEKGRYLHWDKLRHLPPPKNLTSEQWWVGIQMARQAVFRSFPLQDKQGQPLKFTTPDTIQRELHWLDRFAAGNTQSNDAITNPQTRDTYLIRSLIEEAVNSSQLEGASTTRDVAKEMIRQDRSPRDKSEQMILNNYHAMQFIREIKNETLTPSIVLELHRILTDKTMDPSAVGQLRTAADDIHVVDNATQAQLHTPPQAEELENRLDALCDFAQAAANHGQPPALSDGEAFIHPVIRAITLHFMLAYDHPFCDGNGRTARALFYWAMAREGYWLIEFVSISRVIKQASAQYGKAFLYTETDQNDLTYFLIHQLEVIHQAVDALHEFLDNKIQGVQAARQRLQGNARLQDKLNARQVALLRHALTHPRFSYVVNEHQRSHGVSYDIARKDLLQMADGLNLLVKTRRGKRYYFVVPEDIEQRISAT